MSIKLSIIIPTYNRLPHLKKCLDSIFTGFNDLDYEVIVVDGGSNDGSIKYLKSLKDSIILIEQTELIGVVKTLNICFKICKGEYVFPVADDFIIYPNVIENICCFMDEHSNMGLVGPKNQETKYNNLHNILNWGSPYWIFSPKTFIIRKSVLEEIGYFDEKFRTYYIDVDFPLMVLICGYSICVSRDVGVVHYRLHDQDNNKAKAANSNPKLLEEEYKYLQRKWKPLEESIEKYLKNSPFRRQKSYFFKRFCSKMYHSTGLRPFIENHNLLSMSMYDWFLEQTIMFKDKKYNNLKDFFLAQKYPDEIISELK